jgi:hypothetical protein
MAARGATNVESAKWLVAFTLPMVLANFISHVAWHHYYTVLVVPYALAAALVWADEGARRDSPARRRTVLAWMLSVAVITNWVHYAVHPFGRQLGILMLGSLALLIVLDRAATRLHSSTPSDL